MGDSRYPGESEALRRQIREIMAQALDRDVSSIGEDLGSLDVDSMAMLDVLTGIEERFNIILNETIMKDIRTVSDLTRIIKESIRAK